jgi:hypothetical protein
MCWRFSWRNWRARRVGDRAFCTPPPFGLLLDTIHPDSLGSEHRWLAMTESTCVPAELVDA